MDRALPHQRSVSQHNSSSNLEHIALGFGYRRSLTGSDWRLSIGHVSVAVARLSLGLASIPLALPLSDSASGLPTPSTLPLRYFIFTNFSLFFSLTLSQSFSLYLKNESEDVKWNHSNESLSLSLFFKTLTLSDSFELWLADLALTLLIFCPLFLTSWLYPLVWCWCWWDTINCLLVYCDLWLWIFLIGSCDWGPGGGWEHGARVGYLN